MVRLRLRLEQVDISPNGDFFQSRIPAELWKSSTRNLPSAVELSTRDFCRYNDAVAFDIREFKPGDFETLWRIDQQCFAPGISYSKQELRAYIRHRSSFTLVADEKKSGSTHAFIVGHIGPTGHIITIDVLASARRTGLGSALLRAAEDRMRSAGSRAVGLEAAVDNVGALSFYKRHGYSVIRTWPRYYSNGVDALVLRKEFKNC